MFKKSKYRGSVSNKSRKMIGKSSHTHFIIDLSSGKLYKNTKYVQIFLLNCQQYKESTSSKKKTISNLFWSFFNSSKIFTIKITKEHEILRNIIQFDVCSYFQFQYSEEDRILYYLTKNECQYMSLYSYTIDSEIHINRELVSKVMDEFSIDINSKSFVKCQYNKNLNYFIYIVNGDILLYFIG